MKKGVEASLKSTTKKKTTVPFSKHRGRGNCHWRGKGVDQNEVKTGWKVYQRVTGGMVYMFLEGHSADPQKGTSC